MIELASKITDYVGIISSDFLTNLPTRIATIIADKKITITISFTSHHK